MTFDVQLQGDLVWDLIFPSIGKIQQFVRNHHPQSNQSSIHPFPNWLSSENTSIMSCTTNTWNVVSRTKKESTTSVSFSKSVPEKPQIEVSLPTGVLEGN